MEVTPKKSSTARASLARCIFFISRTYYYFGYRLPLEVFLRAYASSEAVEAAAGSLTSLSVARYAAYKYASEAPIGNYRSFL